MANGWAALIEENDIHVIDRKYPKSSYTLIDLSVNNKDLNDVDVSSEVELQFYIDKVIQSAGAQIGYGGYLEQRGIYNRSTHFNNSDRNIHLGVDIWAPEGTNVLSALEGTIHSFSNNDNYGDYGPTIILSHQYKEDVFYTLYGHLSMDSIENIKRGDKVETGEVIAKLGAPEINGNYPPHLHFQIIKDIGSYVGDYPGVCNKSELTFYQENCPDPGLFRNQ